MAEQTLVVLIRGINVGTANQVAMTALRTGLADAGLPGARTHLRSGNVLVTTDRSADAVGEVVQDVLAGPLGVTARVVVRTVEQVRRAIAADPFGTRAPDGSRHVLGFLGERPEAAVAREVATWSTAPDEAVVIDDHVYLWCPDGLSRGPLARIDWERRLGVTATLRNWNTVTALVALADR